MFREAELGLFLDDLHQPFFVHVNLEADTLTLESITNEITS